MTSLPASALLELLQRCGALRRGHFLLSSGLHSPAYVQCALLLQEPVRARRVATALAQRLRDLEPESILSPALGGLILGHEVAAALGLPFRFVERTDGQFELRRGLSLRAGERVVLVEDVVTTGLSTLEAAAVAERLGAEVVGYAALLDRGGGGRLPGGLRALAELDFPTYQPARCPLCAAGGVAEKPGSRPGG